MTRELTTTELDAASALCTTRYAKDHGHGADVFDACPTCRADIVRLVDAPVAAGSEPVALPSRDASVLAELELMTSDADTEEAAQCDKRWNPWAMRHAGIIHGGNATLTVASAIAWARGIVDGRNNAER